MQQKKMKGCPLLQSAVNIYVIYIIRKSKYLNMDLTKKKL
jgi:hypothetical protein